jgi:multidrug efflux system outer membrane protein
MIEHLKAAMVVAALSFVAGCGARVPYTAPATPPANVKTVDPALFTDRPYDPRWWTQFDDPILEELEDQALRANLDVRTAVARVSQARAVFDEVKRDRYPKVTVGADIDWREQVIPGFTEEPIRTSTYRAGFDAFWEIDLFGRVASAVRATSATAASFAAALDAVRVTVAAEVARN